jgi:type IV pilus assembly protein PilW
MRKGLTVLELLIATVLSLVVLAAVYSAYLALFKSYKKESSSVTTQMESTIGLEVLRQDLEHAGYGISKDETNFPIEVFYLPKTSPNCQAPSVHLVIRSTYKTSDNDTQGWAVLSCTAGDVPHCLTSYNFPYCPNEKAETEAVLIKPDGSYFPPQLPTKGDHSPTYFIVDDSGDRCSATVSTVLAFPITGSGEWEKCDDTVVPSCQNQFCNVIEYYLDEDSDAQSSYCEGTYVLKRRVDKREEPFLDCVGDFKVVFNWNGSLCDPTGRDSHLPACPTPTSPSDLRENLKMVYVYLLLREGKEDRDFKFKFGTSFNVDGVTMNLPVDLDYYTEEGHDPLNFRWRVVKIAVKPMNLLKY